MGLLFKQTGEFGMQILNKTKSGMISVELALSIVAILIVLFAALGSITNNVSTMVSNSGMQNFTKENSAKAAYTNYDRNYTNSQVSVK